MAWVVHNGIHLFAAEACLTHALDNAITRPYMLSSLLPAGPAAMETWRRFLYRVLKEITYFSD